MQMSHPIFTRSNTGPPVTGAGGSGRRTEIGAPEPFVVGPPVHRPRQFFGRQAVLQQIFSLFQTVPMRHALIYGPRRSGKTSLLYYLSLITTTRPADLRPNQRADWLARPARYRWILVNFHDPHLRRRQALFAHILSHLDLQPPANCDLTTFLDLASQQIRFPTILMLDGLNAARLSTELDGEFWWGLRSLATSLTGGSLSCLLTADLPLVESGAESAFLNLFHHKIQLGPFTEEEARELIASAPLPFPHADVEWILRESGRWPALLQKMCAARWQALQKHAPDPEEWKRESLEFARRMAFLFGDSPL